MTTTNNHEFILHPHLTKEPTLETDAPFTDPPGSERFTLRRLNRTKAGKQQTLIMGKLLIDKLSRKMKRHSELNSEISYINHSLYALISKNKGTLTKGVPADMEVNKFFGQKTGLEIARKFRARKFEWYPVRRTMIPKPGKKTLRPIDTPTQENRVAQEAISGILEAIFEPEFRGFKMNPHLFR